jgi:hypothetical protein
MSRLRLRSEPGKTVLPVLPTRSRGLAPKVIHYVSPSQSRSAAYPGRRVGLGTQICVGPAARLTGVARAWNLGGAVAERELTLTELPGGPRPESHWQPGVTAAGVTARVPAAGRRACQPE